MKTRRTLLTALASLTALGVLTACGSGEAATNEVKPEGKKGNGINLSPEQNRIHTAKVDAIAAKLPAAVRERGTLVLGVSASSNPPLAFRATDDKTLIGVEVDIATLVADALGLKPEFNAVSWENLFVGLDSGKYDGVFSNVTVTEERKDKYDFATYRLDDLAFEAKKGSGWTVKGPRTWPEGDRGRLRHQPGEDPRRLVRAEREGGPQAGRHQVLPEHLRLLPGAPVRPDRRLPRPQPRRRLPRALGGPDGGRRQVLRGGRRAPGKIAATTKKDSGLVAAYAAALDHVIQNGTYAQVLKRWGLDGESVPKSEINPPGLPRTKN